MRKGILILFSTLIILSFSTRSDVSERVLFEGAFNQKCIASIKKVPFLFTDTIPNDTLYFCFSSKGLPVAVFRNIQTGVCIDGECRVVKIKLYWTITGRYLGYSLAKGQELTKKEHEPFSDAEYDLLHKSLANNTSVLRHYTLEEIQPVKTPAVHTDGISGATIPDLSGYIVPGAAYTTFTLWHLVYGASRDSIVQWTYRNLTNVALDSLISQPDENDRLWALQYMGQKRNFCSPYAERVVTMLSSRNTPLVQHALAFLETCSVPDSILQQQLLPLLKDENLNLRYIARDYYKTHPLNAGVASAMIQLLPVSDFNLVNLIFSIIEKRYTPSTAEIINISMLLESSNKNLAWRAYTYLINFQDQNKLLKKKLNFFIKENVN